MDVTTLMSLLQQQQAQGGAPTEAQVPEASQPQAQLEAPPQMAPQGAPQTDNAPDMRGASQPTQGPPDPIKFYQDLEKQFQDRNEQRKDPNYYNNLVTQILGNKSKYAQDELEKRFKGKGGVAKSLIIDLLTGGPGEGIRQTIKNKAENDYSTAAKEVIDREKSERSDALQQLNLARQEAMAKHQANQEDLRRKDIERKSFYQGVSAKIAQQNANTTAGRKAIQNELDKVKTFNVENGLNTDFGQQLAIMTEAAGGDQEAGLTNLLKLKADSKPAKTAVELAQKLNPDAKPGTPEGNAAITGTLGGLTKATTRPRPVPTGANSEIVQKWADLLKNKQVGIEKVPMNVRNSVIAYLPTGDMPTPMTGPAKTVMEESDKVLAQIQRLKEELEPTKNDDTPGGTFLPMLKYKTGMAGSEGKGGQLADLSMASIVGSARLLKGSSRAVGIFNKAMEHTPNAWVDSDKLKYEKLTKMEQNIMDGREAAIADGLKYGGATPAPNRASAKPANGPAKAAPQQWAIDAKGNPYRVSR